VTLLADVVRTSAQVGATSSRLAKTAALAERLRSLEPDEIEIALPYLSGELRQGKLALGYRTLSPGEAAASPTLTLREVDAVFEQLKMTKGRGSASQRAELLEALFRKATAEEQGFLVRLIVGELRQGALEGVMLEALASASGVPAALVRRAAMIGGGIAPVARAALAEGAKGLQRFAIAPMRPILPMLAQPAASPAAAIAALGEAAFEWKLDGARVQVHKSGDEVRVFTRTLNEVTAAVPEVVAAAREAASDALILDGEAIALRADGRPHPFQTTMRRLGRKADDSALRDFAGLGVFLRLPLPRRAAGRSTLAQPSPRARGGYSCEDVPLGRDRRSREGPILL
jgi:DNA ligase-1